MTITTDKLTRAAGLSAVVAGLLYIFVQLIHPDENVASVTTTAWTVTHLLTLAMSVLALIGVSGLYLRQVRETGPLGLIGFLLFGSSFVVITVLIFVEVAVLPLLADQAPQFVNDVLTISTGGEVTGDVGAFTAASIVSAVTYLFGGLLFGVALFRARIVRAGPPCSSRSGRSRARWFPSSRILLTGRLPSQSAWRWPALATRSGTSSAPLPLSPVPSVRSSRLDPAGAQ